MTKRTNAEIIARLEKSRYTHQLKAGDVITEIEAQPLETPLTVVKVERRDRSQYYFITVTEGDDTWRIQRHKNTNFQTA